jgi:hypothetical protein
VLQWSIPFGIGYPCHAGLEMRRYMETGRRHPRTARADRIYDCDVPVDGSVAFVVSHVGGAAAGLRSVRVAAIGSPVRRLLPGRRVIVYD